MDYNQKNYEASLDDVNLDNLPDDISFEDEIVEQSVIVKPEKKASKQNGKEKSKKEKVKPEKKPKKEKKNKKGKKEVEVIKENVEQSLNDALIIKDVEGVETKIDIRDGEVDLITPSTIVLPENNHGNDYAIVDGKYIRIFYIHKYPSIISLDITETIFNMSEFQKNGVDIAINVEDVSDTTQKIALEQKMKENYSIMMGENVSKEDRIRATDEYNKNKEEFDNLVRNSEGVNSVMVTFKIVESSLEDLIKTSDDFIQIMADKDFIVKTMFFKVLDGYLMTTPIGKNILGKAKINYSDVLTKELTSTLFPFRKKDVIQKGGINMGINLSTGNLVSLKLASFNEVGEFKPLENNGMIVVGTPGSGKAQPVDMIIPTPSGDKRFGDLRIGDEVYDRLGNPTRVTGIHPQGVIDKYEVVLEDGRKTHCNDEHLWTCLDENDKAFTLSLREIIDSGITNENGLKYYIPMNREIEYDVFDTDVDFVKLGASWAKLDADDASDVISEKYLKSSVEQRYELLQGIFDEKAEINKDGDVFISSKNKLLISTIQHILNSLGHCSKVTYGEENTIVVFHQFKNKVGIKEINKTNEKVEMQCISVDNEEHLYLCNDFIVTHNTYTSQKIIFNYVLKRVHFAILDSENEFNDITTLLGGRNVIFKHGSSENMINLFNISEEEKLNEETNEPEKYFNPETGKEEIVQYVNLSGKISKLKQIITAMIEVVQDTSGVLSPEQNDILVESLRRTYQRAGITTDPNSLYEENVNFNDLNLSNKVKKDMPTFSDLVTSLALLLEEYKPIIAKDNKSHEEMLKYGNYKLEDFSRLYTYLKPFIKGGQYEMFDTQSQIDIDSWEQYPIINFNISAIREDAILNNILTMIVMDWMQYTFLNKKQAKRKCVLIDEAHRYLKDKTSENVVREVYNITDYTIPVLSDISRAARKRNGFMILITQSLKEFMDKKTEDILQYTPNKIIHKYGNGDTVSINELVSALNINQNYANIISNWDKSDKGVYYYESLDVSIFGQVKTTDFEHKLIYAASQKGEGKIKAMNEFKEHLNSLKTIKSHF